jgi:hypothetical protein
VLTARKASKRRNNQAPQRQQGKTNKSKEIYLPQSLDKITYQHQHSSSARIASFENNTMKNSTKIKLRPHELDSVAHNAKNGVLSFPTSHKSNPFSNTAMRGALAQNRQSPMQSGESYKVSVYPQDIRSRSTLG